MLSDLFCTLQGLVNLSAVEFCHTLEFHKMSCEDQVSNRLAFKSGDCHCIRAIFKPTLIEEDRNDLDLDLKPEVHVRVIPSLS